MMNNEINLKKVEGVKDKYIDKNGNIHYMKENGLRHREDGPAFIGISGYKQWIMFGEFHREDGPAIINHLDNTERYYLEGKYYKNKSQWESEVIKLKLKRLREL